MVMKCFSHGQGAIILVVHSGNRLLIPGVLMDAAVMIRHSSSAALPIVWRSVETQLPCRTCRVPSAVPLHSTRKGRVLARLVRCRERESR